jgi:hypothetical protein
MNNLPIWPVVFMSSPAFAVMEKAFRQSLTPQEEFRICFPNAYFLDDIDLVVYEIE